MGRTHASANDTRCSSLPPSALLHRVELPAPGLASQAGMRETPGPALRAQFPGPRNDADDMLKVHTFHLLRGSWSERRARGDPPNCGHWRRNLTAQVDKKRKRLLVFGARPACAALVHGS